ncbi:hypothetical protein SLH49_11530 [Cognatiyoonia sp. IB215446]|uniref:hypothetical protein n=1 Tax=Cognatiyoonia sp. IB215446 TaxID=3097355 RepID=UPI002A13F355|nr:hypothetical protein [Cognatiyoonia sp. IB215446]MDX8348615.1 hypothetical protein [Cognatiyoonia sp. IB215446]
MGLPLARTGETFDPAILPDHVAIDTPDDADLQPTDCNIFSGPGFNLIVSQRVREVIEGAGEDRVTFYPINVVDKAGGGAQLPGEWFFVVFEDPFNPVIEERSTLLKLFASGDMKEIPETARDARLVCRRADVAGRSFWTGKAMKDPWPTGGDQTPFAAARPTFTYCSDAVHDALIAAGVMDFDWITKIEEVDDPETLPLTPGLTGEPVGVVHRTRLETLDRPEAEGDYRPFRKHLRRGEPWAGGNVRLGVPGQRAPDLYFHNGLLVASVAAKAEIEALEPGLHRFEPIEFFKSFDPYVPVEGGLTHFAVHLGAPMHDPIIAEMSVGARTTMNYGFAPRYWESVSPLDHAVVFDADLCGNRHLWCRPYNAGTDKYLYFSEALRARLGLLNVPFGLTTDFPLYHRPSIKPLP